MKVADLVTVAHIAAVVGVVSVLVAMGATAAALRGVREQLRLQVFLEFTRRYNELVLDLPEGARDPRVDPDTVSRIDPAALRRFARGYFNLCSEEHFLQRQKKIEPTIWSIWCSGIDNVLRLSWLRSLWGELRVEYEPYREFADFMDERVAQAGNAELSTRSG